METILGVLTGLLILVILVVLHELGHAIAARRNGVVVEEFGIGFPPRAWSRKLKNGVLFSLNWLPLGGFVKLQGEHDAADKKGDYGAASFWQKTKILLAGVGVNWVVAALLLAVLSLTGMPKVIANQFSMPGDTSVIYEPVQVVNLAKDAPAEQAGLEAGDKLIRIEDQPIESLSSFLDQLQQYRGQTVELAYERDNKEAALQVNLADSEQAILGAGLGQGEKLKSTWSAPINGVVVTAQLSWATIQELGNVVAKLVSGLVMQFSPDQQARTAANANLEAAGGSVAGPVGILGTIFPAAQKQGLEQLTLLTALISLTLAIMNTLPIPALDGGRWVVSGLFKLFRKPLSKELEENIQATGFIILMGLVILVTIADVTRLF